MAIQDVVLPGAGSKVAADKIGADRLVQILKLAIGAEGVLELISAGAGAADAGTPRVTLASDDPAVQALASLISSGATAAKQDDQTALLEDIETALTTPVTELPPEPLQATTDLTITTIAKNTSGDTTLVAAVSGQTTRVHRMKFTCDGANVVLIKRGSTVLDRFRFPASGGAAVLEFSSRPWYVTGANEALVINTSTTANVDGSVETVTSA